MVIPAAGKGARFGADIPKQYLKLKNQTIAEHTVQRCLAFSALEKVVVALAADDDIWPTLSIANNARLTTTIGGAERSETVLKALYAIRDKASDDDWIMVHDMARPCVSLAALQRLYDEVCSRGIGALLAVPVNDTVKREGGHRLVESTVDREGLWLAQTPQMFRYSDLLHALEMAFNDGLRMTDEASAMELAGHPVRLVTGEVSNIKVTRPEDLVLAEHYLSHTQHDLSDTQDDLSDTQDDGQE
jgi:2-C-methyl-D-erythritol 4-phosphate cytidylyltransferase